MSRPVLLVIDVQERLFNAMDVERRDDMVRNLTILAADAVCSRTRTNHELGLAQARQAGAVVSATETIIFQLLGRADTDVFREVAKLLR